MLAGRKASGITLDVEHKARVRARVCRKAARE